MPSYRPVLRKILLTGVFTIISAAWLYGCERNTAINGFETYHQRLAKVLDTDPLAPSLTDPLAFPATRSLFIPVEEIRVDLLDAYELRKCGLFHLIAERNSILGKVQDKTRQLRYELLLLNGLQHCLDTLPQDNDLLPMLTRYSSQKRAQLPLHTWNMLTTGEEWRQQFTAYPHPFPLGTFYGFDEALAAFTFVQSILSQNNINKNELALESSKLAAKQADTLLTHQKQIHPYHYVAQLEYSLQFATEWLDTSTRLLEQNENRIICGPNRNQQKAEYLQNVFYKFFVADIQPYLAELDSQYRQIQPVLATLLTKPGAPEPGANTVLARYRQYYVDGELHAAFRAATLNHVKFWQRTFKRCNMKIGAQ